MSTSLNRLSIFATLALSAGCGSCDASPPEAAASFPAPQVSGSRMPHASPASVVSGGVSISLDLPEGEIRAGDMTVTIRAESTSGSVYPHSVDVMSPTMPMHGVARVPVTQTSPGTFTATASIPMSGRWALFVNLDEDGAQSAEFQFDVLPANAGQTPASDSIGGHVP